MHIGFAGQGGAGWAGGAEYIRNLARATRVAAPKARLSLFCGRAQLSEWQARGELFDTVVAVRSSGGLFDRALGPNRQLHRALRDARVDFFYPLTYDNAYNLGATFPLGRLPCGWAGWIPDFQHRHLPDLFSEKERKRRDAGIVALVREADQVVLSSETAADDFRGFYPRHASKARVLTFATFPEDEWYRDFEEEDLTWLPGRFFAVCNQFWSHKNHTVVFQALAVLAKRGVRPVIVCTGALGDPRQPGHAEGLLQSLHRAGVAGQVIILGLVPRRLQIEIIRRSLAVLQPSLFEGWSTVVEDARVLGKPILLSELTVHREQASPGARYFAPSDTPALAELMAEAWASLDPGPHRTEEDRARRRAEERISEVGHKLIEIAAGAGGAG